MDGDSPICSAELKPSYGLQVCIFCVLSDSNVEAISLLDN